MTPRLAGFRQRLHGAAIAITLLAGVLLCAPPSLLHFVLVKHFVCAEHGELVHGGESHGSEQPRVRAAQSTTSGPALRATPVSHDHEHCALSAAARENLALVAPADAIVRALTPFSYELGSAPCGDVARADDVFRVAPKTSPPV